MSVTPNTKGTALLKTNFSASRLIITDPSSRKGGRLQAASKSFDQSVMAITKCLNSGADGELVHSWCREWRGSVPALARITPFAGL